MCSVEIEKEVKAICNRYRNCKSNTCNHKDFHIPFRDPPSRVCIIKCPCGWNKSLSDRSVKCIPYDEFIIQELFSQETKSD